MSEQEVIEPILPESAPSLRMIYEVVLQKAQENNSFAKNIRRRQLEADYEVAAAKGNRRSINLLPRSVIPEKTIRLMLPITG